MSKNHFNSNETLEMCDVKVSQDGCIGIETKSYHAAELERLGKPERAIRGRVTMDGEAITFAPYGEGVRKPTFSNQVVVGSTWLQRTIDKVKISFSVPCHLSKELFVMYVQSEIDEVKRRLALDVYDRLTAKAAANAAAGGNAEEKGGTL